MKKKHFLSIILNKYKQQQKKKKKVEKEHKINLAITAANSGDKPRILTLVVEELKTKTGQQAELNKVTVEAE